MLENVCGLMKLKVVILALILRYVMHKVNAAHHQTITIPTVKEGSGIIHHDSGLLRFSLDRNFSQDRGNNKKLQMSRYFGTKRTRRTDADEENFHLPK